jgi:hypothetical protein
VNNFCFIEGTNVVYCLYCVQFPTFLGSVSIREKYYILAYRCPPFGGSRERSAILFVSHELCSEIKDMKVRFGGCNVLTGYTCVQNNIVSGPLWKGVRSKMLDAIQSTLFVS